MYWFISADFFLAILTCFNYGAVWNASAD